MKVAIDQKALLALMVACGEAQGVLLRGSQFSHEDHTFNSFSTASASARAALQKALDALDTSPILAQQEYHSGPS